MNKTPLHFAAFYISKEMFKILISKGANVNAKDSIYHHIILLFLIKILWKKSRKFNHKNVTPLYYATEKNLKEEIELLLSKGADINAKTIIYQILKKYC